MCQCQSKCMCFQCQEEIEVTRDEDGNFVPENNL